MHVGDVVQKIQNFDSDWTQQDSVAEQLAICVFTSARLRCGGPRLTYEPNLYSLISISYIIIRKIRINP